MIKLISFIVLTHFFQFNHLKILRQPGYLLFKLNQQYFYTVHVVEKLLVVCRMSKVTIEIKCNLK